MEYLIKNIKFLDGTKRKKILSIELDDLYEDGKEEATLFQEIENIFNKRAESFDYKLIKI